MLPQNNYICTNFVLDLYCIVLYCHVLTNSDEIRKDLKFLVESESHSDLNDSQFFYYQNFNRNQWKEKIDLRIIAVPDPWHLIRIGKPSKRSALPSTFNTCTVHQAVLFPLTQHYSV